MRIGFFLLLFAIIIMIFQQKGPEVLLIIIGLTILLALTIALVAYSWKYIREKEVKEEENL